jgi:hypothetical protein
VLRIQRSVLENASRYFKAGIKLRLSTFPPDRHRRVLFYPTADYEAWKVLAYWMVKQRLPPVEELTESLLVSSWLLGEDYVIPDFQDEVMLALLIYYDENHAGPKHIKNTFQLFPNRIEAE